MAWTWYDLLNRKIHEDQAAFVPATIQTGGFADLRRHWTYDLADRVTGVTVDDLLVVGSQDPVLTQSVWTTFQYDAHDRMTRQIDGAGSPRERHTITTYDAAGSVVSLIEGWSPTAALTTADGRTVQYSRPVTTNYEYDALGRLRRVLPGADLSATDWDILGHARPWTDYQYDGSGRVLSHAQTSVPRRPRTRCRSPVTSTMTCLDS